MTKRQIKKEYNILIKKIKYWLRYEAKMTSKFDIKQEKAFDLFLKHYQIEYDSNQNQSKELFLISLKDSGKYPVLNNKSVRLRRKGKKKLSKEYKDYLKSEDWQIKRMKVLIIRGRKCERCKKDLTRKTVDIHHKTYTNLFNEKMEDLEVLCRPCHELHHKEQRKQKRLEQIRTKSKRGYTQVPTE